MKRMKFMFVILAMIMALGLTGVVMAGTDASDTAVVSYDIPATSTIVISGNPAPLVLTDGEHDDTVSEDDTTYTMTTNGTGMKITGKIDVNMPTGLQLTVTLVKPTDASSSSAGIMATVAVDLVTGITGTCDADEMITYTLLVTSESTLSPMSGSRTVTLTVADGT
jgi:hypothetical protein